MECALGKVEMTLGQPDGEKPALLWVSNIPGRGRDSVPRKPRHRMGAQTSHAGIARSSWLVLMELDTFAVTEKADPGWERLQSLAKSGFNNDNVPA